jgi:hypothetical protein
MSTRVLGWWINLRLDVLSPLLAVRNRNHTQRSQGVGLTLRHASQLNAGQAAANALFLNQFDF